MSFEQYQGQRPRGTEPIVGIRKNGQIVLNHVLIKQYGIHDDSYAQLHYDSETNRIGIEISEEKTKGTRKLTILSGCALISGGAFLKHFNVNHPAAKKYVPTFQDGMIVVGLGIGA